MERLRDILRQIDGKSYKAYKRIKGKYQFRQYELVIDHVQGDPFASPTKVRIIVPKQHTVLNNEWETTYERVIRLEDEIARSVARGIHKQSNKASGSGKSGIISIDEPRQEVLERTAVMIEESKVTICLSIGLPARGRTVLGRQATQMLFETLPAILKASIFSLSEKNLTESLHLCDQQIHIRNFLAENGYIVFIGNGSILPRESGVSNRPLKGDKIVPFMSPPSLEVSIDIPHADKPLKGMALKEGVNLIVGGGYHGKSTVLEAIERGIYNHIKGDGREFVLTDESAFKIRAEDGRKVTNVNISPFIENLPFGQDTVNFSTEDASGSTSQAASIMESLEAGAKTLLIDEDTSATNFMIRDLRMQRLVVKEKEPITPFVDKVTQLKEEQNVSTILVMGGSGDYFDVADTVILMDQYKPYNVTEEAKQIATKNTDTRQKEGGSQFGEVQNREINPKSLNSKKGKRSKVSAKGLHTIQYGTTTLALNFVEQLVDQSQTRAIAEILYFVERERLLKNMTIKELLNKIDRQLDEKGLQSFTAFPNQHPGDLARPRMLELASAINRLRTLG